MNLLSYFLDAKTQRNFLLFVVFGLCVLANFYSKKILSLEKEKISLEVKNKTLEQNLLEIKKIQEDLTEKNIKNFELAKQTHETGKKLIEKNYSSVVAVVDRLRSDSIHTSKGGNSTPASNSPTAGSELLGECAEEFAKMARAADEHALDVKTLLQAWPK